MICCHPTRMLLCVPCWTEWDNSARPHAGGGQSKATALVEGFAAGQGEVFVGHRLDDRGGPHPVAKAVLAAVTWHSAEVLGFRPLAEPADFT